MYSRIRNTINSLQGRRAGISPSVDDFLQNHVNEPIIQFTISRTVLNPVLTGAIGIISPSFTSFNIEKNERISIGRYNIRRRAENMPVSIPSGLTLNMILERTHLLMGGKFLPYSAYNNNCTDFALAMLKANNSATPVNISFVVQTTEHLFTPQLRRITNTMTDIAGATDKIIQGGDIGMDGKKVNPWISFEGICKPEQQIIFGALRDERCKTTYRNKN